MIVYPYKTKDGHRSILEAVDRKDAKSWLTQTCGRGVTFCAVDIDPDFLHEATMRPQIIDGYLMSHANLRT